MDGAQTTQGEGHQALTEGDLRILRTAVNTLLVVVPLLTALSIFGSDQRGEGAALLLLTALVLLMGWFDRSGRQAWLPYLMVYALIGYTTLGVAAFGSVRSVTSLGFVGAIVAGGMFLRRNQLLLVLLVCVTLLGGLVWAEVNGHLPQADFRVDWRGWVAHAAVLAGISANVYYSRKTVLDAVNAEKAELRRRELAESEARLSAQLFSRIFRNSPAAVIVREAETLRVIDVNAAFERMYGVRREDVAGQSELNNWVDLAQRNRFIEELRTQGRVSNHMVRGRRSDGSEFDCVVSSELVGEAPEQMTITIVNDISDQMRAREELRRSQERFNKAFHFSPIGMTITRLSDGVFLEVNAADERTLGKKREELVGRRSVDTGTWLSSEDRAEFVRRLREQGRVLGFETRMRHHNGELVDCLLSAELIDIDGEPCVLGSTLNITDQKRREAILMEVARGVSGETGEAFFHSLTAHLASALDAYIVMVGEVTPDMSVQTLSVTRDGAFQPNTVYPLAGSPCGEVITGGEPCVHRNRVWELFPEDPGLARAGIEAYAGVSLLDADGTPIGILNAMWRDTLEESTDRDALLRIFASRANAELVRLRRDREIRKLSETLEQRVRQRTEQLQAVNDELESFAYSVSHDLRSPLRAIDAFTRLLSDQLADRLTPADRELLDRVLRNTSRMNELITDLLGLAQVNVGELQLQSVDLSVIAREIFETLQQRWPQRRVQLDMSDGLHCVCDGRLARIVLENLIGNAWKYSQRRELARISLGVSHEEGRQVFSLSDNGAGFDMAYADKLFKPFTRLHRHDEFEGTGIGLATAHRILERHGGSIRAHAQPDVGATFHFSFDPR